MRKNIRVIIIRILLLVMPIFIILSWHFLTFNEHKYCNNNIHHHVDRFLGTAFLMICWSLIWIAIILIEIIYVMIAKR
jgi:hypothetical protein